MKGERSHALTFVEKRALDEMNRFINCSLNLTDDATQDASQLKGRFS